MLKNNNVKYLAEKRELNINEVNTFFLLISEIKVLYKFGLRTQQIEEPFGSCALHYVMILYFKIII